MYALQVVKASDGTVNLITGSGWPGDTGDGGLARNAQLNDPSFVAVHANRLYISDT